MRDKKMKEYKDIIDITIEEINNKLDWMLDYENDLLDIDFIQLQNLIVDYRNYKKVYERLERKM